MGERGLRLAKLLVLRAMICSTAGDADGERHDVVGALALAGPEGSLRVFLESGPVIAALLRGLPASPYRDLVLSAVEPAEAARLATRPHQVAAQGRRQGRQADDDGDLIEPLSEREVLQLVAVGLSNQQIAERLIISVGTAKKHIENIHGKLDVRSRILAVARPRELALLTLISSARSQSH